MRQIDPNWNHIFCPQDINIAIMLVYLDTGIVLGIGIGYKPIYLKLLTRLHLFGTLVNMQSTSKLTISVKWMGASLIISKKWREYFTLDRYFLTLGWHYLPMIYLVGSTQNLDNWQWFIVENRHYQIWKEYKYAITYCNSEQATFSLLVKFSLNILEFLFKFSVSLFSSFKYSYFSITSVDGIDVVCKYIRNTFGAFNRHSFFRLEKSDFL